MCARLSGPTTALSEGSPSEYSAYVNRATTLGLLPPDALGLVGASAIGELILRPMAPRVRSRWRIEPPTVPDRDDEPGDGDEPPSPEEAPTSPAPAEKLQHADPRSMSRKQRSSTLGASLPLLS